MHRIRRDSRGLCWPLLPIMLIAFSLLSGCGGSNGEDPDEGEPAREPPFFPVMEPDLLIMAPGDRAIARLRATGTDGRRGYDLAFVETPRSPDAPVDDDIDVALNEDIFTETAVVDVDVGETATAGIYRFPIEFDLASDDGNVQRIRDLTVIVVPTDQAPPAGKVLAVASGDTHSLALLEDGSVWAWGRNEFGQLGDGSLTDRQIPVRVGGLPGTALAIAAGGRHSLALLGDGSIWGWGDNREGQTQPRIGGFREFDLYLRPHRIQDSKGDALAGATQITAGEEHSAALFADGEVSVWGGNGFAQLATRSDANRHDLVLPGGSVVPLLPTPITSIAAAGDHTLALDVNGQPWGWGRSDRGQLGAATGTPMQVTPIDIGFVSGVVGLGAGKDHTLLVLNDGNVGSLGSNGFAQLGDGSTNSPVAQPFRPPRLLNVIETDGGWIHSLARQQDRSVYAWGSNDFGQVSDASTAAEDGLGRLLQLVPQRVTGIPPSGGIAAGGRHSLSIDDRCGKVYAWGDNGLGQLGDGGGHRVGTSRSRPEPVYGLGDASPDGGCEMVLAILSRGDGTVTAQSASQTPIDNADCSAACVASFSLNTAVTLTATAAEGSAFVGWGGNCSGSAPSIAISMDRSRNCLAKFGQRPVADFSMDPNPFVPIFHINVRFDAAGSRDSDGILVQYEWDFDGDGSFDATGPRPRHEFLTTGEHPVRLRVTDDQGLTGETVRILVAGNLPSPRASIQPEAPEVGQIVEFDASASTSQNGTLVGYEWDFGDDGTVDATSVTVSHSFATAGEHRVRLRVTDSIGLSSSRIDTVEVSEAVGNNVPPTASFSATPSTADVDESIGFDASASSDDGAIAAYAWDFENDGSFDASGVAAQFSYGAPGTYTVRLRVTDDGGLSNETTRAVTVIANVAGGDPTLTLTILGGPGAGQVSSGEFPVPLMDCINSQDPQTTCSADFPPGSQVFLSPTPFGAAQDVAWTGCDQAVGIEGCILTMTGDRSVTATFQ